MNYLLFAGHNYYPNGGVKDFQGHFESINDCHDWLKDNTEVGYSWFHIALSDMSVCDEGVLDGDY